VVFLLSMASIFSCPEIAKCIANYHQEAELECSTLWLSRSCYFAPRGEFLAWAWSSLSEWLFDNRVLWRTQVFEPLGIEDELWTDKCQTVQHDLEKVTCGVCNETKHKTHFKYRVSTQQKKNFLARYKMCYTCNKCERELDDYNFNPRMKACRQCLLKDKACPVCNEIKDKDLMFATGNIRCISCQFCVRFITSLQGMS